MRQALRKILGILVLVSVPRFSSISAPALKKQLDDMFHDHIER